MSQPQKDNEKTLKGLSKSELAIAIVAVFIGIFGVLLGLIFFYADFSEIKFTGSVDINTLIVTFLAIVISSLTYVGIHVNSNK